MVNIKYFIRFALLLLLLLSLTQSVFATEKLEIKITYITRVEEPIIPLSLLDLPVENAGIMGAQLGLEDSQTTGSFLGHNYQLEEVRLSPEDDIQTTFKKLRENGQSIFIADLESTDLLTLSDFADGSLIFNVRSKANSLRNEQCHASVLHITPSNAMLTDALAQYLAWKRWSKLALVTGRHDADKAYADSLRRSADRFGLKIVEDKDWTSIPGARRTDSGHHNLQQEVPQFTQFKDYDILLVADATDEFGEYLSYRSTLPRPVAGTQGLLPTSWHRTQEQWGATQIQRRFEKIASRYMNERDYAAWAAMRSIAEAVTVQGKADAESVRSFVLSDQFKLAGFKGVPLTFRDWNGQLRQPVLLAGPRMLISVSPQQGFLHERSELDTLGFDKPESACEQF